MKYYERLKEIRIDQDISQKKVAEKIGTTQQQIYKYENGIQSMTIERLIELCKYYKVSADYILGIEKEEMRDYPNWTKYTFLHKKYKVFNPARMGGIFARRKVLHGYCRNSVTLRRSQECYTFRQVLLI